MDRVRLGRVLGRGARLAARTAFEALDAATSPDPSPDGPARTRPNADRRPEILRPARRPPPKAVPRTRPQVPERASTVARGRAAFEPVKRASQAVSLQVSGSFFALFAFSFAMGASRFSTGLHTAGADRYRFAACCLVSAAFAYFAVSNFLRARKLALSKQ